MTTTSPTSSAASSIITSLGTGSGIDIAALTTSLVEAQFAAKTAALKTRGETLTAQISGVSTLKSNITGFAAALTTLVKNGTLQTQPTSSSSAVRASALAGAKLSGLSASVGVGRLATAQTATTAPLGARTDLVGEGKIAITLGKADVTAGAMAGFVAGSAAAIEVTLDADDTLDDAARKINAANAGVTATVVADADGTARLSMKGRTGTDNGFTIERVEGSSATLAAIEVGQGKPTAITGTAGNAAITVDGITVERASNTVTDLVDGVKLELIAETTAPVTLGSTAPTAALTQAVEDFVATYNELMGSVKEQTNAITGQLRGDTGAQNMLRGLRGLMLTPLVTGAGEGVPTTLAEIGVGTNRDGTLSVNAASLSAALAKYPDTIEAMFQPGAGSSGVGLSAALNTVSLNATSTLYGLGASATRYTAQQSQLAEQQSKIDDQSASAKERFTKQFASMDARVAAYKSTQTFLENQIKAWNGSND